MAHVSPKKLSSEGRAGPYFIGALGYFFLGPIYIYIYIYKS